MVIRHPIPNENPILVTQPGWKMLDITVLKEVTHVKSGTPALLTDLILLPQLRPGWRNIKNETGGLRAANVGASSHWMCGKTGAKIAKMDFVWELESQAETMVYGWASNKDMTMPTSSATTALITLYFTDMKTALTNRNPLAINQNWTAATTIAGLLGGLGFIKHKTIGVCDDTVVGLMTWFRRWVYMTGYLWAASFPKMYERFETMTEAQINRVVYDFLCAAVFILSDMLSVIAPIQSERAMLNIGFLENGLISKKIRTDLQTVIDSFWSIFIERNKKSLTIGTSYDQYIAQYLNVTLVSGSTLEDAYKETETPWVIADMALKLGRQMFGIGVHDKGQTTHFAILYDLANGVDTSTTPDTIEPLTSAAHGITTWVIGQNLAIALKYLDGVAQGRDRDWEKMLQNKVHWTYTDMAAWGKTIFSSFSVRGSLSGCAENACYPGIKATVHFVVDEVEDELYEGSVTQPTSWPLQQSYFSDPQAMVSTNNMKIDALAIAAADAETMPTAPWVYPFAFQSNLANRRWSLFFYHDWTEQEIIFWMRYGLLFSREFDDLGDEDHWYGWATRLHACEIVESHTKELLGLITSKHVDIRTASIGECASTAFLSEAIKYIVTVIDTTKAIEDKASSARPKAIDGLFPTIIDNLSRSYVNCQNFIKQTLMPPMSVKATSAPSVETKKPEAPIVVPTVPIASNPSKTEEEDDAA